jgi:flagellar protein FlaG
MNIDSVSAAVAPTPLPRGEAPQQASRGPVATGTPQVATERSKAPQSPQNQQLDSGRSGNQPSREQVEDAVTRLSNFVAPNQSEINFSVDESSGVRVVKIIDRNSNEVIRQMPSEEAVALAQALDKLQGLLIRDKA